jgi:glycerophosphoryl diester phosphodiesterase
MNTLYRNSPSDEARKVIRIAHRGASFDYPENTMLAFQRALEMGVDYLEVDVQLTRDGEVVVMHDPRLDRTTNGTGFVHDYALTQIRDLDAGRGERVPTLGEVFQLARANNIRLCIEVKGADNYASAEIAAVVVNAVQRADFVPFAVITSFYADALRRAKQLEPCLATLLDPSPQDGSLTPREICAQTLAAHANIISYDFHYVTRAVADEAALTGLALWPWAPNTRQEISSLLALPVQGIMTDRPDVLNETFAQTFSQNVFTSDSYEPSI